MFIWRSFQLKTTASANLKVNRPHCLVNSTSLYDLISLGPPVPVNDQSENVFVLDIKSWPPVRVVVMFKCVYWPIRMGFINKKLQWPIRAHVWYDTLS